MSKVISHAERCSAPNVHYPKNLHSSYEVNAVEEVVENDRIVKKSVRKTVDPVDNFKGVKVSDFYLENVIAAGALDSLKFGQLSDNRLNSADNVDAQVANLDDYIVNNVEQEKTE